MYPLPPELEEKIRQAIDDAMPTDTSASFHMDDVLAHHPLKEELYERFVALYMRENRRLRQQVLELWRDFKETADSDELEYGSVMAAGGGEFTCEHIINEIIKPNVYFNSDEQAEKEATINQLIEDLYSEEDE